VRDMRTKCENVRFWGSTGSRRLAVKVTRLTLNGNRDYSIIESVLALHRGLEHHVRR
jgi:hypothetical protein